MTGRYETEQSPPARSRRSARPSPERKPQYSPKRSTQDYPFGKSVTLLVQSRPKIFSRTAASGPCFWTAAWWNAPIYCTFNGFLPDIDQTELYRLRRSSFSFSPSAIPYCNPNSPSIVHQRFHAIHKRLAFPRSVNRCDSHLPQLMFPRLLYLNLIFSQHEQLANAPISLMMFHYFARYHNHLMTRAPVDERELIPVYHNISSIFLWKRWQ